MMTYLAKKVSSIAKGTLTSILVSKLNLKLEIVVESLRVITSAPEIKFLKELLTSSKLVVLILDKSKFNSLRNYVNSMNIE